MSDVGKLSVPLNVDSFVEAVSNYYYVDKTLLIKEVLDDGALVSLFLRPGGFGKSLNMDMLRVFFERAEEDTSIYFENTKIWQENEIYRKHQGNHPVIFLNFSDVWEDSWKAVYSRLCSIISYEFARHGAELAPFLDEYDERFLSEIVSGRASKIRFTGSLLWLSRKLFEVYGERTVIIVDDYDVPFEVAYRFGFYDELSDFLGGFFSAGLKDNSSLAFGFLTGTLRAFKGSVFSGLNNIVVYSLLDKRYAEYFGFTADEVATMADYYGDGDRLSEIRQWYGGYRCGGIELYSAGSLVNYFLDRTFFPYRTYYISDLPELEVALCSDIDALQKLKDLLNGKTMSFFIDTDFVYTEINKRSDYLFFLLMMSGYLACRNVKLTSWGNFLGELFVVNKENDMLLKRFIFSVLQKKLEVDKADKI